MDKEQSDTAIVTSALVVGGIYLYRRLVEPIGEKKVKKPTSARGTVEAFAGNGELLPTGTWVVGAGVTFIAISILGAASPSAGGSAAILVATTTFLVNGKALMGDLKTSSKSSLAKQEKTKEGAAQTSTTPANPIQPQAV